MRQFASRICVETVKQPDLSGRERGGEGEYHLACVRILTLTRASSKSCLAWRGWFVDKSGGPCETLIAYLIDFWLEYSVQSNGHLLKLSPAISRPRIFRDSVVHERFNRVSSPKEFVPLTHIVDRLCYPIIQLPLFPALRIHRRSARQLRQSSDKRRFNRRNRSSRDHHRSTTCCSCMKNRPTLRIFLPLFATRAKSLGITARLKRASCPSRRELQSTFCRTKRRFIRSAHWETLPHDMERSCTLGTDYVLASLTRR